MIQYDFLSLPSPTALHEPSQLHAVRRGQAAGQREAAVPLAVPGDLDVHQEPRVVLGRAGGGLQLHGRPPTGHVLRAARPVDGLTASSVAQRCTWLGGGKGAEASAKAWSMCR